MLTPGLGRWITYGYRMAPSDAAFFREDHTWRLGHRGRNGPRPDIPSRPLTDN